MRRLLILLILACCAALPAAAPRAQDASDKLSFEALTARAPGGNPGPSYGGSHRSGGGYYHRAVRHGGYSRSVRHGGYGRHGYYAHRAAPHRSYGHHSTRRYPYAR